MSRNVGSSSGLSKNSNGSLTSAVSSLVRAQYGLQSQSTPSADTTTDLDKHVAELLLLEAKEKEARLKNSNTQWYFSDDDEDNGKQYQSKTNKRFLKNMLKGVEEHNAPLRRRESEINLEEIRAKERKARELRLGIKDSERLNRSNNTSASASVSGRGERGGPGFAARMLANGLSGALSARDNRTREDRQIKTAIEDARRRADGDRRSDSRDGSSDRRDAEYHSRDVKGKGRQKEEQPIQAGDSDDDRDYRRRRSSRSKDRQEGSYRSSRHRHTRENLMDYSDSEERSRRRRSRSRSRSPRYRERRDDGDADARSGHHREASSRRDSRSPDRIDRDRSSRRRRRSISVDSMSSLSDHASEASSDTFIDYTGAGDAVGSSHDGTTGSKMDKYFSSNYNPALDINVGDLEDPKTGLIGEGNFSEWDKMLHTLKKRKEDKIFGVTKAREEERERQLRKLERKRKREERELRHAIKYKEKKEKKKKKRRYNSSDNNDSGSHTEDSIGPKESSKSKKGKSKDPGTVVIDGFEYGKRGSTRAWDMGKE